jgi:nicotinamidase-related amidase
MTIEGTEGCRLLSDLERAADDRVIVKKRYSAFFRTSLDEILADLKPGALALAGINTHTCVRTTAIDAYQRDYDVVLAVDCIASYDPSFHREMLRYLDGKIARVMSNAEIISMIAEGRA